MTGAESRGALLISAPSKPNLIKVVAIALMCHLARLTGSDSAIDLEQVDRVKLQDANCGFVRNTNLFPGFPMKLVVGMSP